MQVAGGDVGDSFVGECTTSDRDWNIPGRVVAGTELPVTVVSPAGDCAIRYQRARMQVAGGDVGDSFAGEYATSHRDWNITSRVAAVTELPVNVVSPAGDCAIRNQRTRMTVAGGDLSDSFVGKYTTSHRDWNIPGRVVTGPELPVTVVSPAGDCAIRYQRTRMAPAGGDVSDSFVGECTTSHRDWNITSRVATVTELPDIVGSPAGDCAVRNQGTRVIHAGCDVGRWRTYCWSSSRLRRHHPSTRPNNNPNNKQNKNDKSTHE